MFEGTLKIRDKEIPRILLGTSPFIAAAQFGHRARLYYLDLYQHPENILKIIKKSYNLGIKGVQLVPYKPVVEAVNEAISDGCNLEIVGTIRPGKEDKDIKLLSQMEACAMLLHADITDRYEWDFIADKIQQIKDSNAIPGLVTHRPFETTEKLLKSPILNLFDIYMVPISKIGYIMDTMEFGAPERANFRELIKNLGKKIIAKKVLAAGVLKPEEAFDYLSSLDYVDMVAVGIASEDEATETFKLLFSDKYR
ncbi:MAG: hypothetical protein FJ150_06875 [Euryarchaeota archaeon]|nr:hypothetical protein [Euryarchaeota archaeon]